ncbi:MAG: sigma-70 family RNA polymerase sigma factor [Thermoflexales bacterium]|nr:sigma-70 family RNA polymerase sigma factor [Thermoflexales bacterium]
MNDEHNCIAATLRGDTAAFCELVEHYQRDVYNLAYRMMGDSVEAEDAAQEAFLRAYTRLSTYQAGRSFRTWLLSITAHYCIDRLRGGAMRRLSWLSIDADEAPAESLTSPTPGPEDSLLRSERERAIHKLLAGLAPDYRLPIVLRYWYDMSYEEIAEMSGSSVSAIKSRLFRARGQLADILDQTPTRALTPIFQEV